jgi:hypothetical protein
VVPPQGGKLGRPSEGRELDHVDDARLGALVGPRLEGWAGHMALKYEHMVANG